MQHAHLSHACLSIRGLVKIHPGPVCALRGVDLEIPEGMFGLLGPNGAGKSTFMNIVAGLIEPTAGKVLLDGTDVVENPRFMRERLGYLPQDFGFYPDLSGRAMLEFLLKMKGVTGPKGRGALNRRGPAGPAPRPVLGGPRYADVRRRAPRSPDPRRGAPP